jgi:S1-C subfamily serine protease
VVRRGWIGVEPVDLSPEAMQTFGVTARRGVLITGVLQNGPAAKAGIRPGDVITQVGPHPIANVSELLSNVAALKPGADAQFKVQRKDAALSLTVTAGLRPKPPVVSQQR